jgi:hypothetical protein
MDLERAGDKALRNTPWLPPFMGFLAGEKVRQLCTRWAAALQQLNERTQTPQELWEALTRVRFTSVKGRIELILFHRMGWVDY